MRTKLIYLISLIFLSLSCTEEEEILEIRSLTYANNNVTLNVGEGFTSDMPEVDGEGSFTFSFGDISASDFQGISIDESTGVISIEAGNTLKSGISYVIDVAVSNEDIIEVFQGAFVIEMVSPEAIVDFTFAPDVNDPYAIEFTNSSQNAVAYEWDFGDGSEISTEENPIHIYDAVGTYQVTLSAENADGTVNSLSKEVVIDVPQPTESILQIISSSSDHTQLEEFINADSELITALEGNDLTLFAPDDDAFEKLRTALGIEDLNQINPDILQAVLSYHIVNSVNLRASFNESTELETVQGESIFFNANGNIETGGTDTDVEFIGKEILATNGVVQVVETILIPPSIFATIGTNIGKVSQTVLLGADFSTLAAAIAKADEYAAGEGLTLLSSVLAGDDPITVFAPINQVFEEAAITPDTYTGEQWYGIIATHVLIADYSGQDLGDALAQGTNTFQTATGTKIKITPTEYQNQSTIAAGGAPVVAADIESSNGLTHAVAGIVSSIETYSSVLLGAQGNPEPNFYDAFNNIRYSYADARDASGTSGSTVDLGYYFGATNEVTLASIDDQSLHAVYDANGLPIEGIFGTRNSTRFRVTDISPEQFNSLILNSQLESAANSVSNTNTSATNLQVGNVISFTFDADRGGYVGLIKVIEIDSDGTGTGTITFDVKVQIEGN
ncbi:DUF4958 family protein [Marivirga arenosa]|uniref:DUF4958 family protein n=1 Tax=Marivirga arenosa TaxID=3059076 RepID=A0AA51RCT2_9BACT|nr:surface glycan-binding family protein [Marivirga sp. ABR2-2]WMN06140.1 DUF4958 family protein [Marivirga sp. ABR2-2]